MYNTDQSIRNFARLCFEESLNRRLPLKLATKQSFFRQYDARFRNIFADYQQEFAEEFSTNMIDYEHRNIDDMVS